MTAESPTLEMLMPRFALAALSLLVLAPAARSQDAAAKWKSCTHCHQPPDAQFATDRAWLGQLQVTG